MAEKLINITAPQYRCPTGECPAVYKFYGDEFYGIIGKVVNDPDLADRIGEGEAAVEIPADLLLASLGIPVLIEAAEPILRNLNLDEAQHQELYEERLEDNASVLVPAGRLRALREALSSIKGGK